MAHSTRSRTATKSSKAPAARRRVAKVVRKAAKPVVKKKLPASRRKAAPKPPGKKAKPATAKRTAPTTKPPARAAKKPAVPVTPPPPAAPPRPRVTLTVATRQSALAMAQTELVVAYLKSRLPDHDFNVLKVVTTGDQQENWSLEQEGGKGLFVREIEQALLDRRADIAVHSAKDLPTDETPGLRIAGFLPRADPRDVLVIKNGLPRPGSVATGSPRRRQQLQRQFTKALFTEIRGNVETRLRKIDEGLADATVLAAAGLNRLKIAERPGMRFQMLPLAVCVPAAGQGAVAVQVRADTVSKLAPLLDEVTRRAVSLERAFLRRMGGGCQTAFGVHYDGIGVHLYHDACGYQRFAVTPQEALEPGRVAERVLAGLNFNA